MNHIEAMKLALEALEALENNKRTHHYCEDTWYSCPKHEDGCANEAEGDECNCGADKANAEIDKAITALRQAIEQAEQAQPVVVSDELQPCVKLPVTVHVRAQRPGETHVSTREGITPVKPDDLIMRGVSGEEYPIGREIFEKTYQLGEAPPPRQPEQAQPVAWMHIATGLLRLDSRAKGADFEPSHWTPLYTAPPRQPDPVIDKSAAIRIATSLGWTPPRQPLTDEQIDDIVAQDPWTCDVLGANWKAAFIRIARAIEAAHGIKDITP